jgi:fatty acid desaturase
MTAVLEGAAADRAIQRLWVRARPTPPAAELGTDLLTTTKFQLGLAVARPLTVIAMYGWAAATGHWLGAVLLVPFVFLANVVVVHDLMHHSLGLRSRTNSLLLGALAVLMLDSGHALEATHAAHHRRFPLDGDPEAYLARWPVWRVLAEGPRYRYRLWAWVWREHPVRRRVLAIEAGVHVAILGAAAIACINGVAPALSVYVAVGTVGSWLFPVVSVTAVHDAHGRTELQQSRTMRGRIVPTMMLGMGYHLEHHLWPMIPSHHLKETAQRAHAMLEHANAPISYLP